MDGGRVVAENQEYEVLNDYGDGVARGLDFVGREKEGLILPDPQVIAERVGVAGVE